MCNQELICVSGGLGHIIWALGNNHSVSPYTIGYVCGRLESIALMIDARLGEGDLEIIDAPSSVFMNLSHSLIHLHNALNDLANHNVLQKLNVSRIVSWLKEVNVTLWHLNLRLIYDVKGENVLKIYNVPTPLPSYEDLASKIEDLALQGYQILKG